MKSKPELKAKCFHLRTEERMSLSEISALTGISQGTLSVWLRAHPLTEAERKAKSEAKKRKSYPKKDRGIESRIHKMAQPDLTRAEKASIAEAAVLLHLIVNKFEVFGSPFDGNKIDWLVLNKETGKTHKIQVKWAKDTHKGLPIVSLTCVEGHNCWRRYRQGEFDFLIGYDLYTDTCYVWSWDETKHLRETITVNADAAERWDKMRA